LIFKQRRRFEISEGEGVAEFLPPRPLLPPRPSGQFGEVRKIASAILLKMGSRYI